MQRLRGLRHLLSRLLHFRDLHADFADRFVRGLQLLRHGDLRIAGKFSGRSHAGLQFLAYLAKLRSDRLHQVIDLRVNGLALGGQ